MQPQCVYCGTTLNLNTQLTITLDNGSKVTVDICDEHAEDATIKTARIKYVEKQDKIAAFLEQAKALGIEVQTSSSGIVLARQSQPQPQSQPPQPQPHQLLTEQESDEGWVSTQKIDAVDRRGMRSTGGSTEFGSVQGYSNYTVSGDKDVLPEAVRHGKVKMGIAEGRGGVAINIPEKRIDGTGTTIIRIANKESDATLQRRFKKMADVSKLDKQPNFINGYDDATRTCPICRGDCFINSNPCPRCEGSGMISIY